MDGRGGRANFGALREGRVWAGHVGSCLVKKGLVVALLGFGWQRYRSVRLDSSDDEGNSAIDAQWFWQVYRIVYDRSIDRVSIDNSHAPSTHLLGFVQQSF